MIVTLAGHVDHGKTAIVQALTGTNTDRLKDEQARGLTIDLGFAYTTMGSQRIGFVDVPGHHRFIHNMIAGVANQQHALLVIAADDGIMPQTIEHTQILQLLGITSGTIVINKIDLVAPERVLSCREAIRSYQTDRFLHDAQILEVAAPSGHGIEALREHLIETAQQFEELSSAQPFRLAIDRSFTLRGVGTVVTGTVASGTASVGEDMHLTSSRERVRIRSLNVQGLDASAAIVGDRCSLNIAGQNVSKARRGDWILSNNCVLPVSQVSVSLSVLSDFPRSLKHWSSVHVYHLTDHTEAKLGLLESNVVEPGATVFAELHCDEPMHFKAGDRLVLRDRDLSHTLGGATVLNIVSPTMSRRRTIAHLEFLAQLRASVESFDVFEVLRAHASADLVNEDEFARFSMRTREDVHSLFSEELHVRMNGLVMATERFNDIAASILVKLRTFHASHPTRHGMTKDELTSEIPSHKSMVRFALDRLVEMRELLLFAGQYALPEHRSEQPFYDRALFEEIEPMFEALQPVSLGDVAKKLQIQFHEVEKAVRPMVAANVLVQVAKNRYLTPGRIKQLAQTATELAATKPFTVKDFRDASGLGRNTVIDVLEYFDRTRITQRRGDTRVILVNG